MEAVARQAEAMHLTTHRVLLTESTRLANTFHQAMSRTSYRDRYSQNSEALRMSLASKIFAQLCFIEFAIKARQRLKSQATELPAQWYIIQEHQLLQSIHQVLNALGIYDKFLVVPDVYPKESAIIAAQRTGTPIITWNTAAYSKLSQLDLDVRLHQPFLLESYSPDQEAYRNHGVPIVVKSSGSGMPSSWRQKLMEVLPQLQTPFAFHLPSEILTDTKNFPTSLDHTTRLGEFYHDLGGKTRLLIAHPSEVVQIAAEMHLRGTGVTYLALPPRGQHEVRNLEFGVQTGLIAGVILFEGMTEEQLHGVNVTVIRPDQIKNYLDATPPLPHIAAYVGKQPLLHHLRNF